MLTTAPIYDLLASHHVFNLFPVGSYPIPESCALGHSLLDGRMGIFQPAIALAELVHDPIGLSPQP